MKEFLSEESLGGYISKIHWYIKTYFAKLIKENGYTITVEQWTLLLIIFMNPENTQTEIAEKALKDKTNVTRILDLLQKNGYIKRLPDPSDRRKYRIRITDNGEKTVKALFPLAEKTDKAALAEIKNTGSLKKSLSAILENLKARI